MQIIEIRKLVKDISEDCLVLLSTHILHEVQLVCERILMMSSGNLIFNGNIDTFNHSVRPSSLLLSMANAPADDELLSVDGIKAVEAAPEHPGFIRLSIEGDADALCEHLIALSGNREWHLREIIKEMPSADDIFKYLNTKSSK